MYPTSLIVTFTSLILRKQCVNKRFQLGVFSEFYSVTICYLINISKSNYHRKSSYRSHNLEVPGSSPGWPT